MKIYESKLTGPSGRPLPLAAAVEIDSLLFLSGQIALGEDVTIQTERVFDQIEAVLAEAGLTADHIVKASVWLTEAADFAAFNTIYAQRLRAPYPARSCVVSQLVLPNARIEIEVFAHRHRTRQG